VGREGSKNRRAFKVSGSRGGGGKQLTVEAVKEMVKMGVSKEMGKGTGHAFEQAIIWDSKGACDLPRKIKKGGKANSRGEEPILGEEKFGVGGQTH